jgi:predicted amidohydrolase
MSRLLTVAAGQLGPIARNDSRKAVVGRLIDLMRQAHEMKCELIVYPELALDLVLPTLVDGRSRRDRQLLRT